MDPIATERFVKDLKNYRFVVPSYQRGYKWDQQQVSELLDDIYEFSIMPKELQTRTIVFSLSSLKNSTEKRRLRLLTASSA